MATVEWPGFNRLQKRLNRLGSIPVDDFRDLMGDFEAIIIEDNRRGVLAGIQSDNQPMPPVTYRGGTVKGTGPRRGAKFGTTVAPFKGGSGANLTTAQYRKLTGPPLAPRREQSRVIANLAAVSSEVSQGHWEAVGLWRDVVSKKGVPFLVAHFKGLGRLPKRKLNGTVRIWGQNKAREAVRAWAKYLLSDKS